MGEHRLDYAPEADRVLRYNPDFYARVMAKRKEREKQVTKERAAMLLREAAAARSAILKAKSLRDLDAIEVSVRSVAEIKASAADMPGETEFDRIFRRAVRVFGKSPLRIKGSSRQHDLAFVRQFICYWACRRTGLSLPQIARKLGGRDHTTILHGKVTYPKKRAAQGRNLRPAR